ncbi:MAG: nuclear transport factor 2 family protein [Theionarchaea archaeon]|nr:nuclear transport factor 2 family protein [Theionarchaea archaeon]
MKYSDPKTVALLFNEHINNQNLENLVSLMTEDHTFISASEKVERGRKIMKEGWGEFFRLYPDYRNIFSRVQSKDDIVVMLGHSECSEEILDGPAIWTAVIKDGHVQEWRVYDDTEENREKLGIT